MGETVSLLSVIVPTYNEGENIRPLYQALAAAVSDFELIFVDDASPDGTAAEVQAVAAADPRVRLVQREAKLGLGSAVLRGLEHSRGEVVAMMDADLTHSPADLPPMVAALEKADVAVGSRYVKGGRIIGWPRRRRFISYGALLLAHRLLELPVRDATSGYAVFRRQALEGIKGKLSPKGFKLLLEVLVRAPHLKVKEVPITFTERARGRSKMGVREIITFLTLLWELRAEQRVLQDAGRPPRHYI